MPKLKFQPSYIIMHNTLLSPVLSLISEQNTVCMLLSVSVLPEEPDGQIYNPDASKRQCKREGQHAGQRHEVHQQYALPETIYQFMSTDFKIQCDGSLSLLLH